MVIGEHGASGANAASHVTKEFVVGVVGVIIQSRCMAGKNVLTLLGSVQNVRWGDVATVSGTLKQWLVQDHKWISRAVVVRRCDEKKQITIKINPNFYCFERLCEKVMKVVVRKSTKIQEMLYSETIDKEENLFLQMLVNRLFAVGGHVITLTLN